MSDCEMHLAQYKHNIEFAQHGICRYEENEFLDWQITAYFYTVIHLIEYVLVKKCGGGSGSHDDRYMRMQSYKLVFDRERVLVKYTSLEALAKTSRYLGGVNMDRNDAKKAFEYMEDLQYELEKYIETVEA